MYEISNEYIEAFIYQEAKFGNNESGDCYFSYMSNDYFLFAIADGLGNGPNARLSAEIIPKILEEYHNETIEQLLLRCNEQMLQKRGAAVAIAKVNFKTKTISYSSIGNVRFYLYRRNSDKVIYPLSVNGYLSGKLQKFRTQELEYQIGDLFLLHSDGVVMKSPKALMKSSNSPHHLYEKLVFEIEHGDDATFITGRLLK